MRYRDSAVNKFVNCRVSKRYRSHLGDIHIETLTMMKKTTTTTLVNAGDSDGIVRITIAKNSVAFSF